MCNWLLDFLTSRPQHVRLDNHCSSTITINTGVPQGCVMSPFLYSLLTHDCRPADSSNTIIKFADDTTVIGLIKDSDEAAYREEVDRLAEWCDTNNLLLNTGKTKELIVDFRRNADPHTPIHIKGMTVERVNSFKFLGVHISEDLTWTTGCSKLVKKGSPAPFLPEDSEEEPPVLRHPGELLPLHHRKHPDQLHHSLVRELLRCRPEGVAEGGESRPAHRRSTTSQHRGHLQEAVSEEGWENH
ncbi:hypothetical protein L3Q82_008318 [Scortum barcoo]|uniref:Uncharacterized protein n=2 Tax=Scortum barcoo TaxID=214431 RepID=A0ACB8WHU0_9TELE|nr:hypothetical protein L3Q82_008318 [Scortum barcoo]